MLHSSFKGTSVSEMTGRHVWFRGSRSCAGGHHPLVVPGDRHEVRNAASSCLLGFQFVENVSYSCKLYCIITKDLLVLLLQLLWVCVGEYLSRSLCGVVLK